VSDPHFVWNHNSTPELMLTLTNKSSETISKIFFQGNLYAGDGRLLVSEPFSFTTAIGIAPQGYKYVTFYPGATDSWSGSDIEKNIKSIKFSATVENALDMRGQPLGEDGRPLRKKIQEAEERIRKFEKQMADIHL